MKILGIDYGRKKVGLAVAEGFLAEPLKVIRYKEVGSLMEEITRIVKEGKIEKVVVGKSEGKMGKESEDFSLALKRSFQIPVETFDETLSTQEAQRLSIDAGIKSSKRKRLEDAYAAAVMLNNYLGFNS